MLSPVDDDEDEDVRAAVTRTFLVLRKAVKEEEGANASVVLVVVAATTVSVRAARARRSRIMARARSLEIWLYRVKSYPVQTIHRRRKLEAEMHEAVANDAHLSIRTVRYVHYLNRTYLISSLLFVSKLKE